MCNSVSLEYLLVVLKIIQFWWLCVSFCFFGLSVGSPEDHTVLVDVCVILFLWVICW